MVYTMPLVDISIRYSFPPSQTDSSATQKESGPAIQAGWEREKSVTPLKVRSMSAARCVS